MQSQCYMLWLLLVLFQMIHFRQPKKKENSLQHCPSTSLHLIHINQFIEHYLHNQQQYLINYSTSAIRTHLALQTKYQQNTFDIDLNVPYIESEHCQSNQTYNYNLQEQQQSSENFTEKEQSSPVMQIQSVNLYPQPIILSEQEDQEKYLPQDFQFIQKPSIASKRIQLIQSQSSSIKSNAYAISSTKISEPQPIQVISDDQEDDLYRLQETAYFVGQGEKEDKKAKMLEVFNKENSSYKENMSVSREGTKSVVSKKAIFLNKIQREKTRKEIAEGISREKHYIKKFLK